MNKRIFELIQEQNGFRGLLWTEEDKEEFAELIVQECTDICDDIADPTLYRGAEHHSRMAPGASYAAKVIKLRFGIEL